MRVRLYDCWANTKGITIRSALQACSEATSRSGDVPRHTYQDDTNLRWRKGVSESNTKETDAEDEDVTELSMQQTKASALTTVQVQVVSHFLCCSVEPLTKLSRIESQAWRHKVIK